jgi:hypothetical protein
MSGTLCTQRPACGIIADMTRALTGLAAWLAGTAIAVGLAWFGANMVVRDAGMSPGVQVITVPTAAQAAPTASPPAPPTPPPPSASTATPTPTSTLSSPAASRSAQPSPTAASGSPEATPAGTVRTYTLTGGRVELLVTANSASLVTAMPDSGFSVQTWSGTDWLRVDFTSGAQVSSLIATWYQQAPTVTVEN